MPSADATTSSSQTDVPCGCRMTTLLGGCLLMICLIWPGCGALALDASGAQLFDLHCAGCHPNGGNIIRRGRTLKIKALEKQGFDNTEAIAKIAREGLGQMSGYADALGEGNDIVVADWIWAQAQNAWIQG